MNQTTPPVARRRVKKRWIVLGLLAALFGWSWTWTQTPYGKLDWRAAFTLKLLTFDVPITHGQKNPRTIRLPINALFAIGPLTPGEAVRETRDVRISGPAGAIPARIYWPQNSDPAKGPLPVIVYYHGGGFVTGSVDLFDQLTRSLANAANAIVISVDYRLAPDNPWPAGPDDAYAALQWARAEAAGLGGDPARLLVGGDSAGGNIAAVTALRARDSGGPALAGQILYYPVTDLTATPYASMEKFGDGYALSREAGREFQAAYLGNLTMAERANPAISPLKAASLKGLPPALVIVGGFDPLADQVRAYADRLNAEGVATQFTVFPDIIHGFFSVPAFSQRRAGLDVTARWMATVRPVPQPAATAR